MYERTYGTKYQSLGEYPSAATIAKAVRSDLKAAVKAGDLPGVKYYVRCSNFSMGCSVDVYVDYQGEVSCTECNGQRNSRSYEGQHGNLCQHCAPWGSSTWMHPEAKVVHDKVDAILNAYNHDGSEILTDHFDVRYYGNVTMEAPYDVRAKAVAS